MTEFEDHRSHLLGVAYRMLGSLADAEDAVQDAWMRLAAADRSSISDLRGWLTTVTGRLCLDRLRSAQVRREAYVGPWLPEPLIARLPDVGLGPAGHAELAESVGFALLVVLERLTPEQRVAFVLHDVFAVPFAEVAATLDTSIEAARQHAARARKAVRSTGPGDAVPPAQHRAVLSAFLAAARQGDLAGLMRLLAPDVVFTSDGGGVVSAARRPVVGADKVARFLVGLGEKAGAEILADTVLVNGAAGAVLGLLPPGAKVVIAGVISLDVSFDGLITAIDFVANPWKLTRVPVPVAEPGTPAPT